VALLDSPVLSQGKSSKPRGQSPSIPCYDHFERINFLERSYYSLFNKGATKNPNQRRFLIYPYPPPSTDSRVRRTNPTSPPPASCPTRERSSSPLRVDLRSCVRQDSGRRSGHYPVPARSTPRARAQAMYLRYPPSASEGARCAPLAQRRPGRRREAAGGRVRCAEDTRMRCRGYRRGACGAIPRARQLDQCAPPHAPWRRRDEMRRAGRSRPGEERMGCRRDLELAARRWRRSGDGVAVLDSVSS
jgi:hypothetical protein